MPFDLVQIREQSEIKEDENFRFRIFLKRCSLDPDEIDRRVFAITRSVWANIDCTKCANCCRESKPEFSQEEVDRLARRFEMTREQLIQKYLEPAEHHLTWTTRTKPCPFLKDNLCSVYEDRPAVCKGYPYLYEKEFVTRTLAVIDRTSTCPIVFEVWEELKKSLGFFRRPPRRFRQFR